MLNESINENSLQKFVGEKGEKEENHAVRLARIKRRQLLLSRRCKAGRCIWGREVLVNKGAHNLVLALTHFVNSYVTK